MLLCAGVLSLAIERSRQVHLLPDRSAVGLVLKSSLPGIEGTLSVNFLFTLLGILELSLPETLMIGLASTLAQFYWKPARRLKLVQLVFNLSQVTVSSAAAYGAYKLVVIYVLHAPGPLALLVAAITTSAATRRRLSTIIGLTENKPIPRCGEKLISGCFRITWWERRRPGWSIS